MTSVPTPITQDEHTDRFLPEFTWEDVEDALDHLTLDNRKRFALPELIQDMRGAPYASVTEMLLAIFSLVVATANDQPCGARPLSCEEAQVT